MRSSWFVVSLPLVLFAPSVFAQNKPQTEAQQDGLTGAVKSVSTTVNNGNVKWQQPNGPTLVIPVWCRECDYNSDGYRTKSGQVINGKFVGEKITLNHDADGHVTDLVATNTITGDRSWHEALGPFGRIEQTVYQNGKVLTHQTFRYDGSGNLLEALSRDSDGVQTSRTLINRSGDGAWSDETWGKDERVEALNSYNPASDEQHSTTFNQSGNVMQTWTFAKGTVTSYWGSTDAETGSGVTLSDLSDKANVKSFECHNTGRCDSVLIHYEFADPAKHNPVSAEWRDAGGKVLYGAYYTYEFDPSGNWTRRLVWVSSAGTGERTLYETDDRQISYWEN